LRNTTAGSKKRKALASRKAKPYSMDESEVQLSHKSLQQPAGKRKAAEVSNLDDVTVTVARCPAPSAMPVEG
jgi:hypothetical protein